MMCCGKSTEAAASAALYPREAVMPDGSKVTVSSAAQERTERAKAQQRERDQARERGYTAKRN
jgi:hypothetical protein